METPTPTTTKLAGHVGIVTGASSGIGLAVAKALACAGMQVVMVSRSITAELAATVPGAVAIAADVTDRAGEILDSLNVSFAHEYLGAYCVMSCVMAYLHGFSQLKWGSTRLSARELAPCDTHVGRILP
jgi:ribulose 1,5-bisphosphate synthetase/thiazole synthase